MEEEWKTIPNFPDYRVSNLGAVQNMTTGRMMTLLRNQKGLCVVGLSKKGRQHKRSVPLLVAHAFVRHERRDFDQPIHLDGDQLNNRADNLKWRPHWFATKYHMQFNNPPKLSTMRVMDMGTREIYPDAWIAAITNGLLYKDLVQSILNRTFVFPTYQQFRFVAGEEDEVDSSHRDRSRSMRNRLNGLS